MTRKNLDKIKSILILMLIVLISFSLLLVSACSSSDDSSDSEKTYTKVEKDEQELTNGNFEFGTVDVDISDYPYTTIKGWSKSTDNSATSSKVNSGIIDTNSENFSKIIENLVSNSSFKDWAKEKFNIDEEELKNQIKTENPNDDSEVINEKLETKIKEVIVEKFTNPGVASGVNGSKILMLNNYLDRSNVIGTAQKVTSEKTFTLKSGSYGKFSVYVKTAFLTSTKNTELGANIRLTNTVSGVTQDTYAISKINAEEWTKYTIYVKANDFADSTVKLVLGLGYGGGNSNLTKDYIEGTAYFDECVYEEIEAQDYNDAKGTLSEDTLNFVSSSSSEMVQADVKNDKTCFLNLSSKNYFSNYNVSGKVTGDYTTTNKGESASGMPTENISKNLTVNQNSFKVELKNASYTVDLKDNSFSIPGNSYIAIRFTLSMDFSKLQRSGVTVFVVDKNGEEVNYGKTLDNVIIEEDGTYTLIIKNNFDKEQYTEERKFYLSFIIGPVDVAAQFDPTYYTTGTVTIKDLKISKGSLEKDSYQEDITSDNQNSIYFYNVYELLTKTVDSSKAYSTALYAGFSKDYTKEDETENYSFKVAYSDEGRINTKPANVANYIGFDDYKKTYTQLHENDNAGLINSKYKDSYSLDIQNALKGAYDKDNIQPLVINNLTATSYGFASESKTLSADSFVAISVKVRVMEGANAYIYLVNTEKGDNLLKTINQSFTADNGKTYSNDLYLKVTSEDMKNQDWITVNFYVASGKDSISYRVELWNGERTTTGLTSVGSKGVVMFDDVKIESSFTENDVLSNAEKDTIKSSDQVIYTRQLDKAEIEFNKDKANKDNQVSYDPKTVWASNMKEGNNGTFVYAIYNTINPTAIDHTTKAEEDDNDTSGSKGCSKVNGSTFWLSFSSILLGVALIAAMIMLIVKKVRSKHEKNKNDGKVHYKVSSRNKTHKENKAKKVVSDFEDEDEDELDNQKTEKTDKAEEENKETEADTEQKEEYKYGEVLEDFNSDEDEKASDNKDSKENKSSDDDKKE